MENLKIIKWGLTHQERGSVGSVFPLSAVFCQNLESGQSSMGAEAHSSPKSARAISMHAVPMGLHSFRAEPRTFAKALSGSSGIFPQDSVLFWESAFSITRTCPSRPGGSSQYFTSETHLLPPTDKYKSISETSFIPAYRQTAQPGSFTLLVPTHAHTVQKTSQLSKTTTVMINGHSSQTEQAPTNQRLDNLRIQKENENNWSRHRQHAFKKSIHSLRCILLKALTGQIWRVVRH